MITVRTARISDIPEMAIMGREFYDTIPQADMDDYSEAYMGGVLVGLLEHPASTLFVAYDGDKLVGITGALASPKWLVPDHMTGQELFWYVAPDHRRTKAGKKMFDALEKWAADMKLKSFSMVALVTEHEKRVGAMYKAKGYSPVESVYTKEL